HLVVGDALELTRTLLDRSLDVVGRHAVLPGRLHRGPEARVGVDVAPAHARGDRYLLDQLGEQLPAPGILESLLVLDRAPLGMAGHGTCPSLPQGPGRVNVKVHVSLSRLSAPDIMPRRVWELEL